MSHSCPQKVSFTQFGGVLGHSWNGDSEIFLKRAKVNGRPGQMLIDTGCNSTIVSAKWWSPTNGDTSLYPTAEVKLQIGS